ncbi:hypothetical protein FB451DRAFT_1400585 [Mycena latifolia]|nr:hypothetical protein FB451DRAFT_1400585 [Mycena latifolia]
MPPVSSAPLRTRPAHFPAPTPLHRCSHPPRHAPRRRGDCCAFVTLKPEFKYDTSNEAALTKELVLKSHRARPPGDALSEDHAAIIRKIVAGEGDQLGNLSTVVEPNIVEIIKQKVAEGV